MARIALRVMHVPTVAQRRQWVAEQHAALGGDAGIAAGLSSYEVVPDAGSPWATARRAWLSGMSDAHATHICVIQDDVMPARGFLAALQQCADARPDDLIALHSTHAMQRDVVAAGEHWYTSQYAVNGGAVMLRAGRVREFLLWADRCVAGACYHDDVRLACWLAAWNRLAWHTAPSLVEHLGAGHSLLGHGTGPTGLFWPDVSAINFTRVPTVPRHDDAPLGDARALGYVAAICRTGALRDLPVLAPQEWATGYTREQLAIRTLAEVVADLSHEVADLGTGHRVKERMDAYKRRLDTLADVFALTESE